MNLMPTQSTVKNVAYTLIVLALIFRVQAASDILTG